MKNVLSCEKFSREELEEILNLTQKIKENPEKYNNVLNGKIISTLFYEPSTRTRLSFETAVQRLGGMIISTENAKEMSSTVKGETLSDTIRVLDGYCDGIIIRHQDNDSAEVAASVANVPVVNAGSGTGEHPTQALLDIYTIKEHKDELDNLKIAVVGDLLHGRTINSLAEILTLYKNVTIYGVSKEALKMKSKTVEYLRNKNVKYVECLSLNDLPKDVDIIYNTRMQLERFKDSEEVVEKFIIDKEILDTFSKETYIMHPLPRNEEVSQDIDDDPRAIYFEQAHNGVYVRMAILVKIFEYSNN